MILTVILVCTTEGSDYRGTGIQFNVTAGNVRACDEVEIVDDEIVENMENFMVLLEMSPTTPLNINIARRTTNVTIVDDDSKLLKYE